MRAKTLIFLLLACCATSIAWAQTDAALEERAEKLEGRLMSPCCMSGPVADHNSSISFEIRDEIRAMLAEGKSDREILDHYVAEYGTEVLAIPDATGFNLTAYLLPFLLLLVGAAGVLVALLRWKRQHPQGPAAEAEIRPSEPLDPVLLKRLETSVRELD